MIDKTISHYKIIEKLGEGGMGVVYKAEDTKLKRIVALKFLPSSIMAGEAEKIRFIHEAQAAAALDHPNICTVYEIDEADGQLFITMAYIEGQSLKEKIEAGPLKLDEALNIAMQVAEGLQAAHEKKITHRDIKPANIMLTPKGQAKIMDFGLAKLAGRTVVTKEGTTLGTVAYMSPEQARGEEIDHRTDIWALGVVLYEMITGQHPFKGMYDQAVMYSIMNEEPEPITGLRTGVPMELERIVNKALAKKAGERYQHVDEMLIDLHTLTKEIVSGAAKERGRKAKLPRSKRSYLYGGVAGLLVLLMGIGFFLLQKVETKRAAISPEKYRIAVLPLANISPDPQDEYFVDGMTEELISTLSKISNLKVIARTSVMRYRDTNKSVAEIGQELKVGTIIEGSVRKADNKLRITAQLVDVQTQEPLWSKNYDRDLADVFAIQSDIAQRIAEGLQVQLLGSEKRRLEKPATSSVEAYGLYLKGRYSWNKFTEEGLKKGIEYFSQALEKDPTYALAYAGLSDCYSVLGANFQPPKENFQKAKAYAVKAIELDETVAEAHEALGACYLFYDWDWVGAEREIKRAMELKPNSANAYDLYASTLQAMGRADEAISWVKHALDLDPLSLLINSNLGWAYYLTRQYDHAIEQARKTLELDSNFLFAYLILGWSFSQKGMYQEALTELDQARIRSGGWRAVVAELGYTYAAWGQRTEALKLLQDLKERAAHEHVDPYFIAIIYLGMDEKDQAVTWLEKAYDERSGWIPQLKVEPRFDRLRSDSRFAALLKKVG